ncbi:nucleotidyltransferase family protein [Caminibacter sp.]
MRLNNLEIEKIKKIILSEFKECEIYIFGSQLDNNKKGGDIDIFIIPKNRENLFRKKAMAKFFLEEELLRKIDIVIHSDFNREIEKEALRGIKIN